MSMSVAGCLQPWCPLGRVPPHSGVAGGGAPVAGDIHNLHPPHPGWSQPTPLVLTNQPFCAVPLQSATLAEATGRSYLPQCHILGSPPGGCSLFGKCYLMPLPGGTVWLGPFLSGAPSVWNHLGHLLLLEEINVYLSPSVGVCLGTFWSGLGFPQCEVTWEPLSHDPEDLDPLQLEEHQQLEECQQLVEHWQLMEWLILSIHSSRITAAIRANWWASLMRAIISSHVSVCGSELLIHTTVCSSECHMRIRLGSISQQLHPFPPQLCGWPLKPEAFHYWVQTSLWSCSSVDSSHQPLLGSLQNW